jgi:hypothetical protein
MSEELCPGCGGETEVVSVRRPEYPDQRVHVRLCDSCRAGRLWGVNVLEHADPEETPEEEFGT